MDRSRPLSFTFDGRELHGYHGDTLASALLANGVHHVATSVALGRPRGILSAGSAEPTAFVQVEAPVAEPMLPATVVELHEGLAARGLAGRGRLPAQPDDTRYDAVHAHCDVLVIGAGPAGLVAAAVAARSGARVVLVDEEPEPGGSLLGTTDVIDGRLGADWAAEVAADIEAAPDVRVLCRTTAFGYYDHNYVVAVERRTAHLGAAAPAHVARERIWRIRARRVVLATGAHERHLGFADNDRPGVLLAGSARTYLHRYGVLPGHRAVLTTTDDSAYTAAADLADAGVEVAAVADLRPGGPGPAARARAARRGIAVLPGHGVVAVTGEQRVAQVSLAPVAEGAITGPARDVRADLLLVSGGWSPVLHLYGQAGGRLRHDAAAAANLPDGCRQAVTVAGSAGGARSLAACLADGARAGRSAAEAAGFAAREQVPPTRGADQEAPPGADWLVPGVAPRHRSHFVDLHRDVTIDDVLGATAVGLRSIEHVKRYTTAGTGNDQAKTAATLVARVVADALGVDVASIGTTSYRAPYAPVAFAALAGRDRGALHDPVRVTALHDWHVEAGAEFENVGQWKRPRYYPRPGEDPTAAVSRECRAAREDVACMDVSTLGKIEVRGPDAGVLLDRLYTNMISTLKIGAIRYGVMCRPDGMVLDDGTVSRLAADRYLVTTTTGNAAAVGDWMEEWLQTEWPELRVYCTSVTEQWATVALVGPRSRAVLAGLAPGLAVAAADFPFMTWRETVVAGIPALVCRISFSGELAYEINVSAWQGLALWEAVQSAGGTRRITPYGTETMHVLRAEKGYPIVGQDTDGTVTPQDLGMGWVVSKKKTDFLGKRSFSRPDTARGDRKHLVGLLPEDPEVLLPEGGQVIAEARVPRPPVRALGHVTSSYRSAALGRTFALALIAGGRDRIGGRLHVPLDGSGGPVVPVTVTAPVLYDPEGARRDG
ncbi:2Fe-2S iron-sulfur cluster-binding protein [Pseudonocardia bannensis]|uniref:2Fe-2S iron-sulfur cluster-binding protein n=1 Tax=Pseudonocardia bannensis TaxID=630973 RepID=UPI0028B09780|nr:2Fe-2S iron-sulfur cluster-binding protein [Pseudonocardia bannensis]